jgi:hypothetical protein
MKLNRDLESLTKIQSEILLQHSATNKESGSRWPGSLFQKNFNQPANLC